MYENIFSISHCCFTHKSFIYIYKLSRTRKIANRSEINQGNIRDKVELQYSVDAIFVESFFTTILYRCAELLIYKY